MYTVQRLEYLCLLAQNWSVVIDLTIPNCNVFFAGKQAVIVMACENLHMAEEMIMDPGLVMIFAHGVE